MLKNKIMFKIKKAFLISFFVLCVIVYLGFKFIYKEHRDISKESAEYVLKLDDLNKDYSESFDNSNTKYLDKTIVISGMITHVDEINNTVMVDHKISCQFKENPNVVNNTIITIKGRFIGFDELLEEYKLDECSVFN